MFLTAESSKFLLTWIPSDCFDKDQVLENDVENDLFCLCEIRNNPKFEVSMVCESSLILRIVITRWLSASGERFAPENDFCSHKRRLPPKIFKKQ